MFTNSRKLHDALCALETAEFARDSAELEMRKARVERDRATRELQEVKDEYLHRLLFKNVIVHLATEMSIEGVIGAVYGDSVVVRHARCQVTPTDIEQLDGDQVIPRIQISWVQELMPKT